MEMIKHFCVIPLLGICLLCHSAFAEFTFYGRVLDNNNQPVAGAYITAQINDTASNAQPQRVVAKTDSKGSFEIAGAGDSLEILFIIKNGYFFFKNMQQQLVFNFQPYS